jgi:hypothetical protein
VSPGKHVWDYKTTSDIYKWAKSKKELNENIQAELYGYDELQGSEAKSIPMTWVYGQTKGSIIALPVPIDMSLAQATKGYNRAKRAALRIIDLKQPGVRVEDTTFDKRACTMYRGCPHRSYCPAVAKSVSQLFAEDDMGLMDKLNASLKKEQTETPTTPVTVAPEVAIEQPQVNPPDMAESPLELPAKKTRAKKTKEQPTDNTQPIAEEPVQSVTGVVAVAEATAAEKSSGFMLLINAICQGSISLAPLIQQAAKQAADKAGVADYRLVEYGKGPALVVLQFAELFAPVTGGVYSLDTRTAEGSVVSGYLQSLASVTIHGI